MTIYIHSQTGTHFILHSFILGRLVKTKASCKITISSYNYTPTILENDKHTLKMHKIYLPKNHNNGQRCYKYFIEVCRRTRYSCFVYIKLISRILFYIS